MKYKDIIEGIRQGRRELQKVPLDDFTIGLEFEVTVDPAGYEEADDDALGYADDADDFDSEDESELQAQAHEEFINDFISSYDPDDWFSDNYRNNASRFVSEHELEPRYEWADVETAIQLEREKLINRYGEDVLERFEEYVENIPSDNEVEAMSAEEMTPFLIDYYIHYSPRDVTQEQVESVVSNTEREKLERIYLAHLSEVKGILTPDFDENSMAVQDEDGEIVDVDLEITDFSDIARLFDVTEEELKDMTSEDWGEYALELAGEEFGDWWATNRESYMSRHGVGSQANAIAYVVTRTRKTIPEFGDDWKVVPDATAGVDAEIVTPVMPVSQGLRVMHRVLRMIDEDSHLDTSSATGLHVNIGTFTKQQAIKIDWLKFLVIINANRMLADFSREHNAFATDKLPIMVRELTTNNIKNYDDVVHGLNKRLIAVSSKYSAVNLSKLMIEQHIEVRAPGGTGYETKGDKVEQYVRLMLRAIEIASDPSKYKNEYIKKLHKLFDIEKQSDRESYSDPAEYFKQVSDSPSYVKGSLVQSIAKSLKGITNTVAADRLISAEVKNQIGDDLVDYMKTKEPSDKWLEVIDSAGDAAHNTAVGQMVRYLIQQELQRRGNASSS